MDPGTGDELTRQFALVAARNPIDEGVTIVGMRPLFGPVPGSLESLLTFWEPPRSSFKRSSRTAGSKLFAALRRSFGRASPTCPAKTFHLLDVRDFGPRGRVPPYRRPLARRRHPDCAGGVARSRAVLHDPRAGWPAGSLLSRYSTIRRRVSTWLRVVSTAASDPSRLRLARPVERGGIGVGSLSTPTSNS